MDVSLIGSILICISVKSSENNGIFMVCKMRRKFKTSITRKKLIGKAISIERNSITK